MTEEVLIRRRVRVRIKRRQRVIIRGINNVSLYIDEQHFFDYDSRRGNTGVVEQVEVSRYTKYIVKLDPPNKGKIKLAPANVLPAPKAKKLNGKRNTNKASARAKSAGKKRQGLPRALPSG